MPQMIYQLLNNRIMRRYFKIVLTTIFLSFVVNINADDLVSVLYYPDSISFTSEQLVQMRDGIYVSNRTYLTSLEHGEKSYDLTAHIKNEISDIIATNEGDIIRVGKNFYLLNDTLTRLMSFEKKDVRMYPFYNDYFFISYKESGSCYLCKANSKNGQTTSELNLTENIVSVAHGGGNLFITTEDYVLMFGSDGTCKKLLSAWEPFRYSVITGCGLLVGTDNNICLVTDVETFIPLIKLGCKKMFYYEDYLYIYTTDNALLKINFKELERSLEINEKARYLLPKNVLIELK